MLNIYSVEETCSDGLGSWPYWNHRNQNYEIVGPWWPDVYRREKWIWNLDDPQKACLFETPTRRHQKADCFQSNQTQGLCSKAQRHPKASKGLKPENFHGPSRIFWCLLRSSAVDAVRTINPEEPPMSPPGRREMVMKWRFTTEVSNIGCMMFPFIIAS